MHDRLSVTKTGKLFIDGKFPRSESGRTISFPAAPPSTPTAAAFPSAAPATTAPSPAAYVCLASRKDLRDAVAAARKALPGWSASTAYLRGQILYRIAEMIEGKRKEFEEVLAIGRGGERQVSGKAASGRSGRPPKSGAAAPSPSAEVQAAVDRLVCFAGWSDKFSQVLGCNNPVAGPFYNFTVAEPVGVVGVVAPDSPGLLGLVSLIAPALCAGNTVAALAGESAGAALAGVLFAEACATGDVPPGVVNLLTGRRDELVPAFAAHRDIDALHAVAGVGGVSPAAGAILRGGVAENLKRVVVHVASDPKGAKGGRAAADSGLDWYDDEQCGGPGWIESLVNMKTIWHPASV